jgi:hypothetical protein
VHRVFQTQPGLELGALLSVVVVVLLVLLLWWWCGGGEKEMTKPRVGNHM